MRRVLGQCSQHHLEEIEHLTDLFARDEEIDFTGLTKSQVTAVFVLRHFQEKGLPKSLIGVIKEVLIWGTGEGNNRMVSGLEFRFTNDPGNSRLQDDILRFKNIIYEKGG